jgi:hypothetical protein
MNAPTHKMTLKSTNPPSIEQEVILVGFLIESAVVMPCVVIPVVAVPSLQHDFP